MTESVVIRTATQPAACAMCGGPLVKGDRVVVVRTDPPTVVHALSHLRALLRAQREEGSVTVAAMLEAVLQAEGLPHEPATTMPGIGSPFPENV